MPRAYLRLQRHTVNRNEAFAKGLTRAGFEVSTTNFASPSSDDLLVIWNRMPRDEVVADRFQRVAKVIIAENGYIGNGEGDNGKLIALSRTYHNGAGKWPDHDLQRWEGFGVELKPWRTDGETILVLPQRGFGSRGVAMPYDWPNRIMGSLNLRTDRPVKMRRHPGQGKNYEPDFSNVFAAVTWGSGAAIKAIAAGVPVFYDFPEWIGRLAAIPLADADLEKPFRGDRLPMFERLSGAQWRLSEIETGEPFRELVAL